MTAWLIGGFLLWLALIGLLLLMGRGWAKVKKPRPVPPDVAATDANYRRWIEGDQR